MKIKHLCGNPCFIVCSCSYRHCADMGRTDCTSSCTKTESSFIHFRHCCFHPIEGSIIIFFELKKNKYKGILKWVQQRAKVIKRTDIAPRLTQRQAVHVLPLALYGWHAKCSNLVYWHCLQTYWVPTWPRSHADFSRHTALPICQGPNSHSCF